jgi:hypothetical protein
MIQMLTTKTGEEMCTKSKKKEIENQNKNEKMEACLKIIMKWLKQIKEMILMYLFTIRMGLSDKQTKDNTSGDLTKQKTKQVLFLKLKFLNLWIHPKSTLICNQTMCV